MISGPITWMVWFAIATYGLALVWFALMIFGPAIVGLIERLRHANKGVDK